MQIEYIIIHLTFHTSFLHQRSVFRPSVKGAGQERDVYVYVFNLFVKGVEVVLKLKKIAYNFTFSRYYKIIMLIPASIYTIEPL